MDRPYRWGYRQGYRLGMWFFQTRLGDSILRQYVAWRIGATK